MNHDNKCQEHHIFRRGIAGDDPVSFEAGKKTPSYVLLCNNQQVGAMVGSAGSIFLFEVFKPHTGVGHSEIFLELLEQEARSQGIKRIETTSPTSINAPAMIAALKRCGFYVVKEENGDFWFAKDL